MVVIRFSTMFNKIRRGEKKQTIRPIGSYTHLKKGDKIHCYSTRKRPEIRRPITDELLYTGICSHIGIFRWGTIKNIEKVAKSDGFKNSEEMRSWFKKTYGKIPDDRLFRIIQWS